MTLKQLINEAEMNFNFENGLVVYLDKVNKTFRFATDTELKKRGLTHTIKSKDDYIKLSKQYNIDVSFNDFVKISNEAKKRNEDTNFRSALAAMQKDLLDLELKNKKK